jgi:hypothetical protein
LPWAGYLSLIDNSDIVVLLDNIAVSKQSWQLRNRIRARDGSIVWLSVPTHAHMGQPINEVLIDNSNPWQQKHRRTIKSAYEYAPYWSDLERTIAPLWVDTWDRLADLNCALIACICSYVGITTPIHRASEFGAIRAGKLERLIDLCRLVDADTYITTTGATYLAGMEELAPGIPIQWHAYASPEYDQGGQPFQSHLSVIDAIAWTGNLPTTAPSATLPSGTSRVPPSLPPVRAN